MSKYIGKRKLFKLLNQCAPYDFKMKDCEYENWFRDEFISYVANNLQFCIDSHEYGKEFIYTVYTVSDCDIVYEEKICPVFIEK